jgi:hypothetical protein
MDEKLKDMDVLLVREKGSNELKFDGKTLRSDARFSLCKQDNGTFVPAIHLILNKPDLKSLYSGVRFTEEDRQEPLENRQSRTLHRA